MNKLKPYTSQPSTMNRHLKQRRVADRVRALEEWLENDDPQGAHLLIEALSDKSPTMRAAAAKHLGAKKNKTAITPLIKRLADRFTEVRIMAVRSLGDLLVRQKCPPELVACLKDPNELVRIETCESVGAIGDQRTLPALWEVIHDRSALVRSYVAGAIGELGRKKDIPRLEAELGKERSDTARVGFYQALYKLGDNEALAGLLTLLQSTDYRVRCATARILSENANESNAAELIHVLSKTLRQEPTVAAKDCMKASIHELKTNLRSG